jgi:hypothetical protein
MESVGAKQQKTKPLTPTRRPYKNRLISPGQDDKVAAILHGAVIQAKLREKRGRIYFFYMVES